MPRLPWCPNLIANQGLPARSTARAADIENYLGFAIAPPEKTSEMSERIFRENPKAGRFELQVESEITYADFKREQDILIIDFVFAPPVLRGTGATDHLMQAIATEARLHGRQIRANCRFADMWLRTKTQYRDLLIDQ